MNDTIVKNPISLLAALIVGIELIVFLAFLIFSVQRKRKMFLTHRLYLNLCVTTSVWLISMLGIYFSFNGQGNTPLLRIWDSLSYVGVSFSPVLMLFICLVFAKGYEKLPKGYYLLFIVPVVTNLVVWTNPLHGMMYQQFSTIRDEIVFGPYLVVSGIYTYLCLISAITVMLVFAIRRKVKLYWTQVAMLTLGALIPLCVNAMATLGVNIPAFKSIAATPISFVAPLVCNYIAIYRLHLLDIVPIATRHVLDWIPDGYLILNDQRLVVDNNLPFREGFGKLYGIEVSKRLDECTTDRTGAEQTVVYNLISELNSSQERNGPVSYEQPVTFPEGPDGSVRRAFYMIDITPLNVEGSFSGFAVIFKDITQLKKNMEQIQEGRNRLMEQERLALLGQMVGGLAHNLKTPIMSIAGCSSAVETLLQEAGDSLGDPEVTDSDYREIYQEIYDWITKIRQSCSYMSDIITAIKGQAANAGTTEDRIFTIDQILKQTSLLMRHELQNGGCTLTQDYNFDRQFTLRGDINSLIQVLNNLISNSIDAMRDSERKEICLAVHQNDKELTMSVRDTGPGIPPRVAEKLFREMITTKGTKGTGLGLYISATIIRGKFGGTMWYKDNPDGGAIIGFTIPLELGGTATVTETDHDTQRKEAGV